MGRSWTRACPSPGSGGERDCTATAPPPVTASTSDAAVSRKGCQKSSNCEQRGLPRLIGSLETCLRERDGWCADEAWKEPRCVTESRASRPGHATSQVGTATLETLGSIAADAAARRKGCQKSNNCEQRASLRSARSPETWLWESDGWHANDASRDKLSDGLSSIATGSCGATGRDDRARNTQDHHARRGGENRCGGVARRLPEVEQL